MTYNIQQYPWDDDPDFAYFKDKETGLTYFIELNPMVNLLCGHIIIKESDVKLFPSEIINNVPDKGLFEIDKPVVIIKHKGRFFKNSPVTCICYPLKIIGPTYDENYRDIRYVQEECKKLAKQVADYLKI